MGLYADLALMEWFVGEYPKHNKTKLNMGKSCIRFTNGRNIPYDLIGAFCARMSPARWIACYEANVKGA